LFFVAAWSYALCVNFVPAYRDVADRFSETEIGVKEVGNVEKNPAADEEKRVVEVENGAAENSTVDNSDPRNWRMTGSTGRRCT